MTHATYLVAVGSNRPGRHGPPASEVAAAMALLGPVARSRIGASAPVGPSRRRFANAAMLVSSDLDPPAMLARLKTVERAFGRRGGRRWGARVIDLDIILWSRGGWTSPGLTVPHPAFRGRGFVLNPATEIAGGWRDPASGRTVAQLAARLRHPRPVDRTGPRA